MQGIFFYCVRSLAWVETGASLLSLPLAVLNLAWLETLMARTNVARHPTVEEKPKEEISYLLWV